MVACILTQGFEENGQISEAGYRACAMDRLVEGVVCILTQGFGEISGNEIAERVRNDRL